MSRLIVGLVMIAFGALWVSQGTGVFPVGPMANQTIWVWLGGALAIAGVILVFVAKRQP